MILDTVGRIRAIERAMRDIVIPAIDPERANAREQADYVVMHLGLIATHVDSEYPAQLAELRQCLELVDRLAGATGSEPVVPEQARDLAALRLQSLDEVKTVVAQLRSVADELLREALDSGDPAAARAAVLDMATRQEALRGAWIMASLDPNGPDALRSAVNSGE